MSVSFEFYLFVCCLVQFTRIPLYIARGEPGVAMELLGISECLPFPHPPDLVQLLLSG